MLTIQEFKEYQKKYEEIMQMLDECCISDNDDAADQKKVFPRKTQKRERRNKGKRRGPYRITTDEEKATLLYLYYVKFYTVKEAALEVGLKYSTAYRQINLWRGKPLPPGLQESFEEK